MATNYNHIAYSKSVDGKKGFSTLYPNLNLGTYTDENQNSSTNPEDYTWEMMNYRIYLDGIAVAGTKTLSSKVENLKPDTSYTLQVKQVSGEEESDFSDSVTFKTNVQK